MLAGMTAADRDLKQAARFVLSRALPEPPAEALARLAALPAAADAIDEYGAGGAVAQLERATAERLGHPAGLFFIKGVMAQLCVLRAHAEARGCTNVVIHPLGHMDIDEAGALERAGGLTPIRLGRHRPFTAAMLDGVTAPLAAVVVELPLRRAGFLLPALDELRAISAWCRARDVPLHLDGARLWESAAGYGVSEAELAALADSVYVSWYKGLGGLGGATVTGSADFIASLRPWKTRYGGDLVTAYPYALSALDGLQRLAPRLPGFVGRARALAEALQALPELVVHPRVPHTNAFQLWLPGTPSALAEAHRRFAAEHRAWLFDAFGESPRDGYAMAEIQVGPASDGWSVDEAVSALRAFLDAL
jgi:threonine aldolase